MTDELTLTDRQRKRFDRIKDECKDPHTPDPTDAQILNALMDTWDAVDKGFYGAVE